MTPDPLLTRAFDEQRARLTTMAYRILGSHADADDAVQETWLRLARQQDGDVKNPQGWLTTVVSRVCIDMLRSRMAKREATLDEAFPELIVTEDEDLPEGQAEFAESVGLALLVVLDTLRPDERLAFVLHDVFAVPFVEIADIVGKSVDATKMLASRARQKVRGTPRSSHSREEQRRVVDAFLAAAGHGDFEGLLRVLNPDVSWRTHTARGTSTRLGAHEIAEAITRGASRNKVARRVLVNGDPGVMVWDNNGRPRAVMTCRVRNGQIVELTSVIASQHLAQLDLPNATPST